MDFSFFSLVEAAPPHFVYVPQLQPAQLRRRIFCLYAKDSVAALNVVGPVINKAAGLIVVPSESVDKKILAPFLWQMAFPPSLVPSLAEVTLPMLDMLQRLRSAEDKIHMQALEFERDMQERKIFARDYFESRDGLLKEIAQRKQAQEELLKTTVSRDELLKEVIDRKRAEEELQSAYDLLKATQIKLVQSEKMASLGLLAAGVAHEINNPLGFVICNFSVLKDYLRIYQEVLLAGDRVMEDMRSEVVPRSAHQIDAFFELKKEKCMGDIVKDIDSLLDQTLNGLQRVKDIVSDLKTFAHADPAVLTETDIHQLVDTAISFCSNELKYKVKLTKKYGNVPLLVCNKSKLEQVFVNLLINAAQAIKEHGTIDVVTFVKDGIINIQIIDNGKGIAPEHLNKVFDPFFTTKPVGQGTGLGLSISYDIIKQHGGDILVSSEVGYGTTFTILFPLKSDYGSTWDDYVRI